MNSSVVKPNMDEEQKNIVKELIADRIHRHRCSIREYKELLLRPDYLKQREFIEHSILSLGVELNKLIKI